MSESFDNLQASLDKGETTLTEISTDLNDAVAEIQALKEQLESGLTPDQATAVQERLDTLVSNLQDAAKIIDPTVPPDDI